LEEVVGIDKIKNYFKSSDAKPSGGGSPFLSMLCVLFIGLKLTGHIAWSWWWVLSPIWIPIAVLLLLVAPITIFLASRD
jgi:uncharacterized protein (DUF983 family)